MLTIGKYGFGLFLALLVYLALWPVPVEPVAWEAPPNPGYTGEFALNDRLAGAQYIDLGGESGPEDVVLAADGTLLAAMHGGKILRIDPASGAVSPFADTGGRPLGLEFGPDGVLYVADAYLGLMSVSQQGEVKLIADRTSDGSPILYADDLDIAADGRIYFSDASTRFAARQAGGTLDSSILDLIEHSSNGRVLVHDPASGETRVFADGLNFANGVALSADDRFLFVVETGMYRVLRYALGGDGPAQGEEVLAALPGFPDNINPAGDDSFWVGLVSPRNDMMDGLSQNPFLRKVVVRLPAFMRPAPTRHGFILRMDDAGRVLETLQDPAGGYALTTGAVSLPDGRIAVSSLSEPRLAIVIP